eukprot:1637553-Pleurochrysis_carterae.AAC.2
MYMRRSSQTRYAGSHVGGGGKNCGEGGSGFGDSGGDGTMKACSALVTDGKACACAASTSASAGGKSSVVIRLCCLRVIPSCVRSASRAHSSSDASEQREGCEDETARGRGGQKKGIDDDADDVDARHASVDVARSTSSYAAMRSASSLMCATSCGISGVTESGSGGSSIACC